MLRRSYERLWELKVEKKDPSTRPPPNSSLLDKGYSTPVTDADGGLEMLVCVLRDFCLSPPPSESPLSIYGPQLPTLNHIPTVSSLKT
ncbi:hypothetical protein BD410DRAFT_846535 [Rickenella mellea]|uniref:Uncharacterized protein n=1 Tax=Rickenella mellea TaxID=50990 RepID=A0A4Y7PHL5_9AGAM|nr:hypothetical protein BD410DRAFT_846535 [Rickenella mellea]